jgi:hypothetical protein
VPDARGLHHHFQHGLSLVVLLYDVQLLIQECQRLLSSGQFSFDISTQINIGHLISTTTGNLQTRLLRHYSMSKRESSMVANQSKSNRLSENSPPRLVAYAIRFDLNSSLNNPNF